MGQLAPVVLMLDAVPESIPVARHVVAKYAAECDGEAEQDSTTGYSDLPSIISSLKKGNSAS